MISVLFMDFSFYHLISQQLASPPDLSVVSRGELLPEEWPVILMHIERKRKQVEAFIVTDGNHRLICMSKVPDLYDRINTTELGTIIHLLGPRTVFNTELGQYVVYIEDFATLKQYDDHLRKQREAEAKRLADLADMNELDEAYQTLRALGD